jgi:pyrophosphatase PpaX
MTHHASPSPAAGRAARPLAVLFDLDGTLIDSIELLLSAFRHAFTAVRGSVPSEEAWIAGIGTPLVTQLRGFTSDEAEVAALVAAYREYQHAHHDRLVREFEGVGETLALLRGRGHPMALVTSKGMELAQRALVWTELRAYMDAVVGADMCERHKPHPEPVHLALELIGYEPADAVFVGDSPHDVEAGNAAGVATVAALWGPFDRETLAAARPTHRIAHIAELPPLLERLESARAAGDPRARGIA